MARNFHELQTKLAERSEIMARREADALADHIEELLDAAIDNDLFAIFVTHIKLGEALAQAIVTLDERYKKEGWRGVILNPERSMYPNGIQVELLPPVVHD